MDPSIDFQYFNPAPIPATFFGLSPAPLESVTGQDNFQVQENIEHYDPAFVAFQQHFQYDPTQFVAQQISPSVHKSSSAAQNVRPTMHTAPSSFETDQSRSDSRSPTEPHGMTRSSSEEKDSLTPQQNKRKAQNRAAQRAFRERKERHVKDLEARNTTLQREALALQNENERLRKEIAKLSTENEILRATSGTSSHGSTPFVTEVDGPVGTAEYPPINGNKLRTNKDGTTDWNPSEKWAQFGTLHTVTADENDSGEPLLNAGATWDYIQSHDLFKRGLVEIGDVCERLKKMARCDGSGPVFQEKDIRLAISESAVAGGRDELI